MEKLLKKQNIILCFIIILLFAVGVMALNNNDNTSIMTNGNILSNKKIGWGIKRNDKHEQPDLGVENKKILDKYDGICIGNKEKPYVYLTFDNGYEAGYTEKILDTLKENDVKATFFITGHYLNTQDKLIERMIDEGHIVGNHSPHSLMDI